MKAKSAQALVFSNSSLSLVDLTVITLFCQSIISYLFPIILKISTSSYCAIECFPAKLSRLLLKLSISNGRDYKRYDGRSKQSEIFVSSGKD